MADEELLVACRKGNLPAVERLLDNGVDPAAGNNHAIELAATRGHLEVVNRLLQDPRVDPAANDNRAIRCTVVNDYLDVVNRLLQDPRVDPAAHDNESIVGAAMYGRMNVVNRLLQDPRVDPAARKNDAILLAVDYGCLGVVERLLQDNRVGVPMVALVHAANRGRVKILQKLLCDWRVRSTEVPLDELLRSRNGAVQEVLRVWREDVGL